MVVMKRRRRHHSSKPFHLKNQSIEFFGLILVQLIRASFYYRHMLMLNILLLFSYYITIIKYPIINMVKNIILRCHNGMAFNHRANLLASDNVFLALKIFIKNESSLYSSICLIFFIIIANEKNITIRKVIDVLFNCFPMAKYSYTATINRINTKTINASILHLVFFFLFESEGRVSCSLRLDVLTSLVFGSSYGVFIDIIQIKDELAGSTIKVL